MKKKKQKFYFLAAALTLMLTLNFNLKADDWRSWEYSESSFENGAWTVTELCNDFGSECHQGSVREIIIEPE